MYSWPITFVIEVYLPGLLFCYFSLKINFQKDLRHNFDPTDFASMVCEKEVQGIIASSGFQYHLLKTMVLSCTKEFLMGYGIGGTFDYTWNGPINVRGIKIPCQPYSSARLFSR